MGDLSAMWSIDRVLERHSDDLRLDYLSALPVAVRECVTDVALTNVICGIQVHWVLHGGAVTLEGPIIDVDVLAQWLPDCEVGY